MLETCFLPHVYHFLKGIFFCDAAQFSRCFTYTYFIPGTWYQVLVPGTYFCDAVHNSRVRISFIFFVVCDGKFIDSFDTIFVYSNEDGGTTWYSHIAKPWGCRLIATSHRSV